LRISLKCNGRSAGESNQVRGKIVAMSDIDRRLRKAGRHIEKVAGITVIENGMEGDMNGLAHALAPNPPLYSRSELVEHRRNILRYARSFPPGPERNQHRQIAGSLRTLFRNRRWLEANVLKGS
jgi:hypothetical protein